jgi:diacylglycerol O-acyltransferase
VTNVPGPQFPLYLQGSRMLAMYPQVPLLQGLGLCIALISYDGKLCWGFNADPRLVPDLDAFLAAIRSSQARVLEAARQQPPPPAREPRKGARARQAGNGAAARPS